MSIQIPKPKKNGDKLLVWWLRLSTENRWFALLYSLFPIAIWLTGAHFAPQDVVEIGRLAGRGQTLAALSMGAMTFVWYELVRAGHIIDSVQSPSSLWLLLVWIGPVGVVYSIWLLHQESWPWERPLAWLWEKWQKLPRWLRPKSKERFKDGDEVMRAWEKMMAQKKVRRKQPVDDQDYFFPWETKLNSQAQTTVGESLPQPHQSSPFPVKAPATESAVEEKPRNERTTQAAKKPLEKPVQLQLPMVEAGEKSDEVNREVVEHSETDERRRRPGRPGSSGRRWRRNTESL
ncbi:MAG: hypothetical protein WAM60_09700 [Candidatus Promineifilaceae bacterium]